MKILKGSFMSLGVIVLIAGLALVFSGCASCGTCTKKAPSTGGMLHGAMGCHSCEKSSDSPLVVDKEMPRQIVVGKPFTYTITVTNQGKCAVDNVVVTERVPEKFELKTADPEPTKVNGRVAEWNIGYLAPKETRIITITGAALDAGATITCTNFRCEPLLCLGPDAIAPNLQLMLEAPSQALICDTIPVRLTVTNSGTGYAQNVRISEALPQGLTTVDGKDSIEIAVGDLAGGTSKSYSVNLRAAQPKSYTNGAKATADSGLSASSDSITTAVQQPSLKIGISGPDEVFVTKNVTYDVKVQNVGDVVSANTRVAATIPSGMSFVSASNGGDVSGGSVVWNIGNLDANKSLGLKATYKAVAAGSARSVASASGTCCSEVSDAAETQVKGIAGILLEVIDVEDPIHIGDTEKFYITVTNQGTAADKNIVVKVKLEENFDYVSSSGPTSGKAMDEKSVAFAPLASLAAGQKVTWEVLAKATKDGDHRLSVSMTSDMLGRPVDETEATRVY